MFESMQLEVTPKHLLKARQLLAESKIKIGDAFKADLGQVLAGHLGEVLLAERLSHCRLANSEHYDLVAFVGGKTVTLDVEVVMMNVPPEPNFLAQVTAKTRAKQSSAIGFVAISDNLSRAWAAGWLWRNEFFQIAGFKSAGSSETWPSGRTFTYSQDCYAVNFSRLRPFSFMQGAARSRL